jgi:hypothetical protein
MFKKWMTEDIKMKKLKKLQKMENWNLYADVIMNNTAFTEYYGQEIELSESMTAMETVHKLISHGAHFDYQDLALLKRDKRMALVREYPTSETNAAYHVSLSKSFEIHLKIVFSRYGTLSPYLSVSLYHRLTTEIGRSR